MLLLQSIEHQEPMQGEQFEPAIERIGDPVVAEKYRFARPFDDGFVEAQGRVAVPIAMKQRCERHSWSDASNWGRLTPYRAGVQFAIRRWRGAYDFQSTPQRSRPRRRDTGNCFAMSNRRPTPYFLHCAL